MRIQALLILLLSLPPQLHAGTIRGKVLLRGLRDNSNAIVYIEKIPGKTFQAPREPLILDQVNIKFTPHVLPILLGTRVAFPNSDAIRHNVFSPDAKFNLGTYPSGQTLYRVFNTPGEVTLLCNVHAEMSAYIFVTETPYFAVTDAAGNYTINNVPAGSYTVAVWHERLKSVKSLVVVPGNGAVLYNPELRK